MALLILFNLGSRVLPCPGGGQMHTRSLVEAPVAISRGKLGKEAKYQSQGLQKDLLDSVPGPITWGRHWVRAPYLSPEPMYPVTPSCKCPQRLVPCLDPSSHSNSICSVHLMHQSCPSPLNSSCHCSSPPALYNMGLRG